MNDEEIVSLVKAGNTQAFAHLVDKYRDAIYNYILHTLRNAEDAADLAQDTFIKAFQALPKFRGDTSVKNWLYRIASTITIDWLRKKKVRTHRFWNNLVPEFLEQEPEASPERVFLELETKNTLAFALRQLPFKYRQVIVLYHYQGLSYDEIAQVVGHSRRTVETRLYRGRKRLKDVIIKGGQINELRLGSEASS